ncbi:MAG: tRNA pseudouridine(38-40) synthase TruA [Proteobacteria bacterium]|nr:tRNA pseudouridine(38-40) synthase TruA [Pseudomonadota bacterium]
MTHYKIILEYEGSNYCGWQKQTDLKNRSIAEILENAIFNFAQERPKIIASGRTDAGVHALGQVVNFSLSKKFTAKRVIMALNNYLRNEAISVIDCEIVDANFHSRFDAKMRYYRYLIINRTAPLTLQKNRAWHVAQKLDLEAMKAASQFLIGKHDFSAFRDSQCQSNSTIRSIKQITITQNTDEIVIEISAKSFLHHMVRNIVGTLFWVGINKIKTDDVKNILASSDRTKSGPNAPAHGLYFLRVDY